MIRRHDCISKLKVGDFVDIGVVFGDGYVLAHETAERIKREKVIAIYRDTFRTTVRGYYKKAIRAIIKEPV